MSEATAGEFAAEGLIAPGLTIITGHYGCGKTTLALDLAYRTAARACAARSEGRDVGEVLVRMVDLDIANPFFRSSDDREALARAGVHLSGPAYANSNLDAPALEASIYADLQCTDLPIIMDVGGDDVGGTTLGRFAEIVRERIEKRGDVRLLYVVNDRRLQTSTPEEALGILREIERACGLRATGIVGNCHLQEQTTPELIAGALPYVQQVAALADLPVAGITAPAALLDETRAALAAAGYGGCVHPIELHLFKPWE